MTSQHREGEVLIEPVMDDQPAKGGEVLIEAVMRDQPAQGGGGPDGSSDG